MVKSVSHVWLKRVVCFPYSESHYVTKLYMETDDEIVMGHCPSTVKILLILNTVVYLCNFLSIHRKFSLRPFYTMRLVLYHTLESSHFTVSRSSSMS